jgi:hypothetical protein
MKLAMSNQGRPTTQTGRIYALEQARKTDGERLEKIEKKVDDIHNLLVNVRGFKWVMDGVFKYSGQIAIAAGALYGGWKFFTGH